MAKDAQIIAALMSSGTITGAAKQCGTTPKTIYNRMKDPQFRQSYQEAQTDLLRGAVTRLNDHLLAAVDTAAAIMGDPEINPAIRLQAAKTIISNAGKLSDRLNANDTTDRKTYQTFDEKFFESIFGD